jgi:hypothetical protein
VSPYTGVLLFAPFLAGEAFHATLFFGLRGPLPPPRSGTGFVSLGPKAEPMSFCAYVAERDGLRYLDHVTPWTNSSELETKLEEESDAYSSWTAFTHWAAVWIRDDLSNEAFISMLRAASAKLDSLVICGEPGREVPRTVRALWWLIGVPLDSVRSGHGHFIAVRSRDIGEDWSWTGELDGTTHLHLEPGSRLKVFGAEPYDVDLLEGTPLRRGNLQVVFHPNSRLDLLLKLIGRVNEGQVKVVTALASE